MLSATLFWSWEVWWDTAVLDVMCISGVVVSYEFPEQVSQASYFLLGPRGYTQYYNLHRHAPPSRNSYCNSMWGGMAAVCLQRVQVQEGTEAMLILWRGLLSVRSPGCGDSGVASGMLLCVGRKGVASVRWQNHVNRRHCSACVCLPFVMWRHWIAYFAPRSFPQASHWIRKEP